MSAGAVDARSPPFRAIRAGIVCVSLLLAARAEAQYDLAVVSIDHVRTDSVRGETRHEILPVAVFDAGRFHAVWTWHPELGANTRRPHLLGSQPSVQVLHRGRGIGTLEVADIDLQSFHCSALVVGTGPYAPVGPQPTSEITHRVSGSENGQRIEYETQSFIALSGAASDGSPDGAPLVTDVVDPDEIERFAEDVRIVAPRSDLVPLSEDETRAYRLDAHDAAVVVRKRRSAAMIEAPFGDLPSPLLTDAVLVRTGDERSVHPLVSTATEPFAWGAGDRFFDAFALPDGTVYLVFETRGNETIGVRLFELGSRGAPAPVFDDVLYGC